MPHHRRYTIPGPSSKGPKFYGGGNLFGGSDFLRQIPVLMDGLKFGARRRIFLQFLAALGAVVAGPAPGFLGGLAVPNPRGEGFRPMYHTRRRQQVVPTVSAQAASGAGGDVPPPAARSKFAGLMSGERVAAGAKTSRPWPSVPWEDGGVLTAGRHSFEALVCTLPDDEPSADIDGGGKVLMPPLHNRRKLHYLRSLLSKRQVSNILDCVESFREGQKDSGAECFVAIEDGAPVTGLAEVLRPAIDERILPAVRALHGAPDAVVADALVRWYDAGDGGEAAVQKALPPHYDVSAFATVILPLNPRDCEGGLYIQHGAGVSTRVRADAMAPGDAVLHAYDAMHGVRVTEGVRLSLVLWFTADRGSLREKTAPWVARAARKRRSVHAAFLHGMNCAYGLYGEAKDAAAADEYWGWAGRRGHALSMYCHAMLLMKEVDTAGDAGAGPDVRRHQQKIVGLLRRSATSGLDMAQHEMGTLCKGGYRGVVRDHDAARRWYGEAAQQGYLRAAEILEDPLRWED